MDDKELIDRRPIITCAGELEVFSSLEDNLITMLPQDTCEWRRSSVRPPRMVNIGATFAPFSPPVLPKISQWDLVRQPIFHIYWTECSDIEVYKSKVREDIEEWLKELNAREIPDWLIVVVESYDSKRSNKLLPRTTVLDKIRTDFAPKQGDRCVSVISTGKVESRAADSFRGLVVRVRHLLLVGYARAVSKLEDHVRHQRECRNETGWNFIKYFKLQEELAQIFEMLGLYDEALVQYDELDALFSQFVVNCQSDISSWLSEFQKPLEQWRGLKLGAGVLPENPSLLELRGYLFAKQAQMLLNINKVWEMASRCLPFLHTCSRELSLLEIGAPVGAVACWVFLACVEVLQTCDRHNQADQVDVYSLHTANLWAYASQKLRYLGEICGLMPNSSPNSDQLHTVVYLSAGMGDNVGKNPEKPSPTDKLKQAIRSQCSFNKTYLELAELAMGTYKHIGRLRSARLIGREVASFYMLLNEVQKAAAFLTDLLRTFEQDGWKELASQTQIELAECYKKSKDIRKYVRACVAVSAAGEIDNLIRWSHFDEMQKNSQLLDRTLMIPFKDVLNIISVSIKNEGIVMQDTVVHVELIIESNFPREVLCDRAMISIETDNNTKDVMKKGRRSSTHLTSKDLKSPHPNITKLHMKKHLDYQQDKQLSGASVVCKNVSLKRTDSNATPVYHSEFNEYFESVKNPFILTPGVNNIRLTRQSVDRVGKIFLGQVALHVQQLIELISVSLSPRISYDVKREEPKVRLDKNDGALISGIEQTMLLTITVGSYPIGRDKGISVTLKSSMGLLLSSNESCDNVTKWTNCLELTSQVTEPYERQNIPVQVLADFPSKEHQITIISECLSKATPVVLCFTPPLITTWRLHTVKHRKFVQISVTGQCDSSLIISNPALIVADVEVRSLHNFKREMISNGLLVSFTYEILPESEMCAALNVLKAEFNLEYIIVTDKQHKSEKVASKQHSYFFEISDYLTLYKVKAKVEPTKGNEFCRVGTLCHLQLTVVPVKQQTTQGVNSLMYEVLAEQSLWAVCGRTAGVISFESMEPQFVVLEVMPLNSGYLPLPLVRLSKYIPADFGNAENLKNEQHPRLEPFNAGQVYNMSKGRQIHVITSSTDGVGGGGGGGGGINI